MKTHNITMMMAMMMTMMMQGMFMKSRLGSLLRM